MYNRYRSLTIIALAVTMSFSCGRGSYTLGSASHEVVIATIYLSPTGNDANSGTSASRIKSLWRAEQIVKTYLPLTGDIDILIGAGTYNGQSTYWDVNLVGSSYKISIKAETTRPIFQGCTTSTCGCTVSGCATDIKAIKSDGTATGGTSYWNRFLSVDLAAGGRSGLVLNNIQVRNYREGIYFRNADSNTISNSSFYKLGDGWGATSAGGVAHTTLWGDGDGAIHTITSSNNTFGPTNTYDVLFNQQSHCPGCIHAVYLAASSNNNTISASTFTNISGDPIRIRDQSNNNLVQATPGTLSFIRAGDYAASLWGSNSPLECRSWTNNVNNARIDGNAACGSVATIHEYDCNGTPCNQCQPPGATYTIHSGGTTFGSSCSCLAAGATAGAAWECCSNSVTGSTCN